MCWAYCPLERYKHIFLPLCKKWWSNNDITDSIIEITHKAVITNTNKADCTRYYHFFTSITSVHIKYDKLCKNLAVPYTLKLLTTLFIPCKKQQQHYLFIKDFFSQKVTISSASDLVYSGLKGHYESSLQYLCVKYPLFRVRMRFNIMWLGCFVVLDQFIQAAFAHFVDIFILLDVLQEIVIRIQT